jgi:transposase
VTGANRHDLSQLLGLVDAIPPVRGKPGRPRRRPHSLLGDRGYHSKRPRLGCESAESGRSSRHQRAAHGSGLGRQRWVVERTLSWLHQHRRLRLRYERRADIHEAFVAIACSLICLRALQESF